MLIATEISKEEREAAINQRIEEMRKRNEEIIRRHQEIENDKKNAETFSQEALERMKRMSLQDAGDSTGTATGTKKVSSVTTAGRDKNDNARPKKESRKPIRSTAVTNPSNSLDYRPQRLSEHDLPPPDPVYSYLTDRLREGAFCAPISPPKQRKYSTASSSDMSISSSGTSSRKVSTASNSSWTSDSSSSKCNGFANYQPPRKFSACRNYFKDRRISGDLNASIEENELCGLRKVDNINEQTDGTDKQEKTFRNNWSRPWDNRKTSNASSASNTSGSSSNDSTTTASETTPIVPGNRMNRMRDAIKTRSNMTTNWRKRQPVIVDNNTSNIPDTTRESEPTVDLIEDSMERMALTHSAEDNNNNGEMANRNVSE